MVRKWLFMRNVFYISVKMNFLSQAPLILFAQIQPFQNYFQSTGRARLI